MATTGVDGPGRARRFATYNTLDLFAEQRVPQLERYEQVAEVIRGLDADVVAVQEIITDYPPHAGPLLGRLAQMTGMTAAVTPAWATEDDAQDAVWAVGVGGHGYHVGLLWRSDDPGLVPVPGSLRSWGSGDFFHALVRLTLVVDGSPVTFASYHAPPLGRNARADQAERVMIALTRPVAGPVLLGGDMNAVGASRVSDPEGGWSYYDPDPAAGVPWFADLVYQCDWRYEPDGRRVHWSDRRPNEILLSGGFHDVAAALNAPWRPTTGHHPEDVFGEHGVSRRLDLLWASQDFLPRLRSYEVLDTPLARATSDHLPTVVTFQT